MFRVNMGGNAPTATLAARPVLCENGLMLEVEKLSFRYGRRVVLAELTFSVHPGEVTALLGPNGSGKSTLLRCLCRILRPTNGAIRLGGDKLECVSVDRISRRIAFVPQRIESAPISVYEAVLLGRKPYFAWTARDRDLEAVDQMLQRLGLSELARRPVDRLSGGETQKVALARALVQEPDILLLDEPTSALDLKNQFELLVALRDIVQQRNISAILSMHDLNAALRYADRYLLIRDGRLVADARQDGLTPEIIERVYALPVDIHTTDRGFSFVVENNRLVT